MVLILVVVVIQDGIAIGRGGDGAVAIAVGGIDAEGGSKCFNAHGCKEGIDVRRLVAFFIVRNGAVGRDAIKRIGCLSTEAGRPAHVPVLLSAAAVVAAPADLHLLVAPIAVIIVLVVLIAPLSVRVAVVGPGAVFILDVQGLEVG